MRQGDAIAADARLGEAKVTPECLVEYQLEDLGVAARSVVNRIAAPRNNKQRGVESWATHSDVTMTQSRNKLRHSLASEC